MKADNQDIVIKHIKTKNKVRKITTYVSDDCELRAKHIKINKFICDRFIPSVFSKGYVSGRSIYDNALAHMYNDFFLMLDIRNFFPSICHQQLAKKLFHEMNLIKENQISLKECNDIIDICSIGSRGLPLGFITSPVLSNVYLKEFDCIFYGRLKRMCLQNAIFTRYADDITISFQKCDRTNLPIITEKVLQEANLLLSRYGLQLNNKKTRTYDLTVSNHVRITGISIIKGNDNYRHLSVGRALKNELFWRAMKCIENHDQVEAQRLKGLQAFILSVEKTGYENCYSEEMKNMVRSYGYKTVYELINSL